MAVFLQQIASALKEERKKCYKKILYYSVNYTIGVSTLAQQLSHLSAVREIHVQVTSGSSRKDWRGTVSPHKTGSDLIWSDFLQQEQNCRRAIQAHFPLPADPAGLWGSVHVASPAPYCYLPSPSWGNASAGKCPHKVRCCLHHHRVLCINVNLIFLKSQHKWKKHWKAEWSVTYWVSSGITEA